jgi:hypothetical protein
MKWRQTLAEYASGYAKFYEIGKNSFESAISEKGENKRFRFN